MSVTRADGCAILCLLVALTMATAGGCASSSHPRPYEPLSEADRNPLEAQRLTLQAADLASKHPAQAEDLLRRALTADLYHGPAHNNLGVLYLRQGRLYEAAGELEWARKLMPGHPDPRVNLGLVLERAGRVDDALLQYESALEVYPGHIQAIQALTRLQLRSGRADDGIHKHLGEIALRGETEDWRAWARERLALRRP